jgi:hypothetical protein
MRKDESRRSWSAGCGESYLSGVGSAGRKPPAERQQGAVLRLHYRHVETDAFWQEENEGLGTDTHLSAGV